MPYFIVKSRYPSTKIEEVNARFVEMVQKFPPDTSILEQVVPVAAKSTDKGIEVLTVNLVKEGKFDEAYKRIGSSLNMFRNIEGFEVSIEVWGTLAEAQSMTE